jgi:hypothetical protein
MSDEFFDRVNQANQNWFGEDRGPEEIKRDWDLYGRTKRAEALDQLDEYLRTFTDVRGEHEIRKYAKLTGLQRDLFEKHKTLMRIGR